MDAKYFNFDIFESPIFEIYIMGVCFYTCNYVVIIPPSWLHGAQRYYYIMKKAVFQKCCTGYFPLNIVYFTWNDFIMHFFLCNDRPWGH